jgi:hypothetical protein
MRRKLKEYIPEKCVHIDLSFGEYGIFLGTREACREQMETQVQVSSEICCFEFARQELQLAFRDAVQFRKHEDSYRTLRSRFTVRTQNYVFLEGSISEACIFVERVLFIFLIVV